MSDVNLSEDEVTDVSEATESMENDAPTQAQLYDDLRRIGQLEDQKQAVQREIDERIERLRQAVPSLDRGSLLHKLLSTTLKVTAAKATPKKKPVRSTKKATTPTKVTTPK